MNKVSVVSFATKSLLTDTTPKHLLEESQFCFLISGTTLIRTERFFTGLPVCWLGPVVLIYVKIKGSLELLKEYSGQQLVK